LRGKPACGIDAPDLLAFRLKFPPIEPI